MQQIQNYELLEKIKETKGSVIYRGRKTGDDYHIIIKLLKSKYPSPSDIARFKQEYEIIKSINLEGVIKTYDIISHAGAFALILEDFDGVSLKSILVKDKPFDIDSFLRIAPPICETLGELHKCDIIHRDIKPHNILINQSDSRIKITDFGISTVLTRENEEI
jgi:serine/threonine protein kinase